MGILVLFLISAEAWFRDPLSYYSKKGLKCQKLVFAYDGITIKWDEKNTNPSTPLGARRFYTDDNHHNCRPGRYYLAGLLKSRSAWELEMK